MLSKHVELYEKSVENMRTTLFQDPSWTPRNPEKCMKLLTELASTTNHDTRIKLLRRFRDAFDYVICITEFSSIKNYNKWIQSI
jgi:hypothetical protein